MDNLQTSGAGNESSAKGHVVCKHVFNSSVRIFNIFAHNRYINRNTGFTENRIYPMQGLKYSFIGIRVPCFTRGNIHAFYAFAFRGFHGPLE